MGVGFVVRRSKSMTAKAKVSGRAKISLILKRNIAWARVSPGIRFLTTAWELASVFGEKAQSPC